MKNNTNLYNRKVNNYKRYNNEKVVYKRPRKDLSTNEYRMLWTIVWLLFIFGLCLLFKSAVPLLLLFVWFMGII